jgi:hypothetical protein
MTKNEELAYIAGIIDGEGYLGIGTTKSSVGNICYYPRLTIHMLDEEAIKIACDFFKIKIRRSKLNKKDYYSFYATGKKLKEVLLKIISYLQVKKTHALLLLELIKTKDDYKPIPIRKNGHFAGTKPVPKEVTKKRKLIYDDFRKLQERHKK